MNRRDSGSALLRVRGCYCNTATGEAARQTAPELPTVEQTHTSSLPSITEHGLRLAPAS
eukprot:m.167426 g.167426  ORF g.167426 m.167426 type:complete len:59 (-) comp24101_c0_seq2:76-252(-)